MYFFPGKKRGGVQCCKSLEDVDLDLSKNTKSSTLPKTKHSASNKKGWKFFVLGRNKDRPDGWSSQLDIEDAGSKPETDNQSLPSTSQLASNCPTAKTTPLSSPRKNNEINNDQLNKKLKDQGLLETKLKELKIEESAVVTAEKDPSLI